MKRYIPKEIEPKWQQLWRQQGLYKAVDFSKKPKFVMLTEFPYPSGEGLHLGHIREYTYGDIISRRKRMQGMNVLFPMGYDAFGLPTENYAIKNKVTPQSATETNVRNFQAQFESLGYGIDWTRTFRTSDPAYYKWTQWLFLRFFAAGLAYQDETAINWCPHCKTGLANEEVVNGRHERCDTLVEKKVLKQWLLKITAYADRLIEGLKNVDYPSRIADQQINWIGRSEGAEISFYEEADTAKHNPIKVFTTRPDTIFGATFLVIAPEHPSLASLTANDHKASVNSYVRMAQSRTDVERQEEGREKTGVFLGSYAINPASGERIPIWTADYVLGNYGTGAIMAVPAHDERDWDFSHKFGLPIKFVVSNSENEDQPTSKPGRLINSGEFDGLESDEAKDKIISWLEHSGSGKKRVNYRLRDWIFSRQHYWGEPIPIIHCPKDGAVAVPEADLPVQLPEVEHYEPTDTGESPLAAIEDWVNVSCPVCGGPAKRETDTMPNWAGSSWYYLRFYDPHNDTVFAAPDKLEYWSEVDIYLGGMEHTTLHLLYSRFWHQFLYDQKLVPTPEPYAARRGQGIILAADGSKMSKSKGNVVNPNDIIESGYGADALRLAMAFLAPYDQTTPWSPESVAGTHRFLQRLWTLAGEVIESQVDGPENLELRRAINRMIDKVDSDTSAMNFNTAIAAMMEAVNRMYRIKAGYGLASSDWRWAIETLTKVLSPYAPHISEEIWHRMDNETSVHVQTWPQAEAAYLVLDMAKIAVQVNGKLRAEIEVPVAAQEEEVVGLAQEDERIKAHLSGKKIVKTIFVPGKVVNFVIG
ncbi:MAG TPA: leucine--tRNA ligase [Candidatus Saccharimonadales bacterium]|nr:leucine--tRNA ligase [Candidatus Saccharimonadales bacterium]